MPTSAFPCSCIGGFPCFSLLPQNNTDVKMEKRVGFFQIGELQVPVLAQRFS